MTKDTGGQAFPGRELKVANKEKEIIEVPTEGMTLRQWYAGQALTGIIMYCYPSKEVLVEQCYEIADAMIKEGKK